jgi:folate-binding protein YgfZ
MKRIELTIVSDAGMTLQDEYRVIQEGAALVAAAPRARIAVSGKDRASYLHGLLTNDILALQPGSGCYAAWLTPQGRMVTDMHVLEGGDMILLDVPAALRELVLQRLDQFLFAEDVQLGDVTDALRSVTVHGPRAAEVVGSVIARTEGRAHENLEAWPQYRNARADFTGTPVVIARIDQLGVPGFTLYVDAAREADLIAALETAGAVRVGDAAVDAARIEAGYPIFGVDMDDDIIPLEAGIEPRAISFTKGCYVGQEVIIRVLHRGGGRVARRLVGLRLQNGDVPARGTRVHAGDRDVGFVTSGAQSPRLGTISLAYVHRDFVTPGTSLEIGSEGSRTAATVSALPFDAEAA